MSNTPMLDRLKAARVMEISSLDKRTLFRFWEACDGYFSTDLTRDEVRQLAEELLEMTRV